MNQKPLGLAPSEVGAIIIAIIAFVGACASVIVAIGLNPLP